MYVVANGLFNVGIFACLHRPDTRERVPVIGGGRADQIDGFVVERLTHIHEWFRTGSLVFLNFVTPSIGDCFVRINDDPNFRAFIGQIFSDM